MNNLILGIIALILASAGYWWSWRFQQRDHYGKAIGLMIVSALCLYLYISADFFLHHWDERYHALVAKNLLSHPLLPTLYNNPVLPYDFRDWQANHIWLHKQPLALWGIAGSMGLFGVNELAVRLPSIVLVSIAVYLVFSVGSYLFNKNTGYLAAFFFSINGLLLSLLGGRKATDHVDVFFMFFILLSVYLSIQYCKKEKLIYSVLVGITIGLAILSKWLPALIVIPILLLLAWDSGKFSLKTIVVHFIVILITLTVVFLPWQLYIFSAFPQEAAWESSYNLQHLSEGLEGHSRSIFFYLNRIRINYGEIIYLPLGWFIWRSLKNPGDKKQLAVLVWFLVPFVFFSVARTKMQAYLFITAPALFFMTAEFFYALVRLKDQSRSKWIINLVLTLLVILPIRYGVERLTVFEFKERNPQWVIDLRDLQKENFDNGVLFNYNRPIEAMFYTDLTVYPTIPSIDTISALQEQGYTIIIRDDGNVPEHVREVELVVIKRLTQAVDD
ncbi:MAG: phospholipid carrier-dependent glycosyltransferase [Desulfofustis sp.]|nr:phospholipid carrier-dependent glycosyltransferase [Desulfofustis sp.]